MSEPMTSVRKNPFPIKLVWTGLTLSLFLYLLVAYGTTRESLGQKEPNLDLVFWILAFATGLVSTILYAQSLTAYKLRDFIGTRGDKVDLGKAIETYALKYVVCWVLNEMICIYGLVFKFMTNSFGNFLPFFIISLIMNLLMYPKLEILVTDRRRG